MRVSCLVICDDKYCIMISSSINGCKFTDERGSKEEAQDVTGAQCSQGHFQPEKTI